MITPTGTGPLYQQIYRSVRESILCGRFIAGSRLPVTRSLAKELDVSRNVVLIAYEQLISEGYATGRTGSGTYVSDVIPDEMLTPPRGSVRRSASSGTGAPHLSPYGQRVSAELQRSRRAGQKLVLPDRFFARPDSASASPVLKYDFAYGRASATDYPDRLWRKLTARRLRRPSLNYAPPEGNISLRNAIAAYLRRSRGVRCETDNVLVVNGTQQALNLATRLLVDAGDSVVMENPHYIGARQVFLAAGAQIIGVPVDGAGLCVDQLPSCGRHGRVRFAYVTPSHQFPAGAILPLERRLRLLSWAGQTGAYILEDDYDSEFRYDERPVESVQGLDRGQRVIYIGSFSKIVFPALRLGYMVIPEVLMPVFARAKLLEDRHTATFQQEMIAEFIAGGHFERHLRLCRSRNAARRAALLESIDEHLGPHAEVSGASAGLHVLVWLRNFPVKRREALISAAAAEGLGIYSAHVYYLKPPKRCELILGYGALTEHEIRAGIGILGSLVRRLGTG